MRSKLIIGLAVFAFLLFFIPKVGAASGQLYQVDSEKLMVRASADPQGEIVAELQQGDLVTVFQNDFGWGRTFYNGQEAWVAVHHLVKLDEQESSDEQEAQVNNDERNSKENEKKRKTEKEPAEKKLKQEDGVEDDSGNPHSYQSIKPGQSSNQSGDSPWKKEDAAERKLSSAVTIEKNDKKPLSGYHFVIDPGHGGKDSGTKGANILEKTLTLSTAKKVAEKLHQKGATVTMTRTDDRFISLAKRVQISNVNQTDAFISLHFNSYTNSNISGLNTFYYSGGQDAQFAKTLQSALIRHTELVDRGAKKANYYVLRNNKDLAVLIELGFLSNPDDRKKVQTETYQQQVAEGITSGLEDYFK